MCIRDRYRDIPANDYYRDGYNLFLRMEKYMQNHLLFLHCLLYTSSTRFVDTLITASPEFFKGKSPKEIQAFFQRAADLLIGRVGRENIVSAVVHMDEKTPHLHLTLSLIHI